MNKTKKIIRSFKFLKLSISFLLCFLSFTFSCFAKEISFEVTVDTNKVSLGSSLQLALNFSNAQDISALDLSTIEGFQTRYLGPSTMMSIVNGKVSGSITHNYMLLPTKIGSFKIGPFKFQHNGDQYTSNQLSIEVLSAQAQSSTQSSTSNQPAPELRELSDRLFVTIQTEKERAYLNEIIPLTIRLYVNRLGIRDIQLPEFSHEGFSVAAFDKPNQYQEVRNGINFDVIEFNTAIFGLRPGEFKLGPAQIKCNLITPKQTRSRSPFDAQGGFGANIFDDFFARYETHPLDLKSNEITCAILSLPQENKPIDFSGALGNFEFEVTAAPLEVKLGDPITLKMTVNGQGNLNTVGVPKLRSVDGLKIYEPQIKQEANKKSFEQIIMPMSREVKEVPAISFDFFDTSSGQYKTISRGPFPIVIINSEKEESRLVENKQIAPVALIKEEKFGRDIIYIKDNPGPLKKKNDYLYKHKIFLGLQIIPLLFYLLMAIFYAKKQRLKTDLKYARGLLAPRKAKIGIGQAKKYLAKADMQKFYDTLFLTMQEYLGDKFHLSSKGITISVIDEHLRKEKVAEEILVKLKDIFRECDMVRYASSQLTPVNMRDALNKLEEAIDYLQRKKT